MSKCKCGQLATWLYMPGDNDWNCCDDCVPRGCSCNNIPKDDDFLNEDPNNWEQDTDEQGRKLPCCEWWYNEKGFNTCE